MNYLTVKKTILVSTLGTAFLFAGFFVLNILFPVEVKISYSKVISARDGTIMHAFLSSDDKWRMKTELSEITPLLKKTIINKEDRYFYYHPGINPFAIVRAALYNIIEGKKTSGASTITMQVARMLDHKPRTYSNKIIEMFRALQLELVFNKDEILQLYLNLIPYGGNIEGVKSAALIYFGQTPDYLSLAQLVTLAIIPNRPSSLLIGKNNERILQERNKWLKAFESENLFPRGEIEDALNENLDAARRSVPRLAPHISIRLAKQFPLLDNIPSTIDYNKQGVVENLAFNYMRRVRRMNITNCAVMVLNNQTGQVEAYIGSSDFSNTEDHGQVDGVTAVRSPGSTLKPLLYALAFDRGIATPKSVVSDVPVNYEGYIPENFDKKFHGAVTIEEALANSLNVPAVKTLDEIGVDQFIQALKVSGFSSVQKKENELGLSVILGGCGVTLEQLVRLYSCFANQGREKQILYTMQQSRTINSFQHQHSADSALKIISPAAAFMVSNILTEHTRPDLPDNYQSSTHLPKIAWKTGTSYGRRDAWSLGYNKYYTIGVWVGNFDGTGSPVLTGADIATPLLFSIFNSIEYNSDNEWLHQPDDCDIRLVCSVSGKMPEDYCSDQVIDYFIPGVSPTAKCNHMKEVLVSGDENISYCRNCLPPTGYKKILYTNIQPELLSFYESENIPYLRIPPHNPECSRIYVSNAPMITSPVNGLEYLFEKESGKQLMLSCNADNEVKEVYWYVNNIFYRNAGAHDKVFFSPQPGEIKISCADDKGRNTDLTVRVTMLAN